MLTHEETLVLIEKAQAGSDEDKQKLLEANLPLIKSIIRRYRNVKVDYEDLVQLGCMGLVKAINNFDPKYGVRFSTYAVPMIAGEIKRFIRDDGAVKVSRALKTLSVKLHNYIDDYVAEKGENPSIEHLAEYFQVDKQEIVYAMDSNKYPVSLYEKFDDEGSGCVIDRIPAKENSEDMLDNIMLRKILEELPERERTVITLRYFRDMTQSEIAGMMGVSQVQISRIESRVIERIRSQMA